MKGSKAFYLLAVVSAVLIIGVAYAAITNVTLDVDGYAKAAPSDANFKVAYTGTKTVTVTDGTGAAKTGADANVTATANDGATSATLNIDEGVLVSKGDKVTATFEVDNASVDLLATLATSIAVNEPEGTKTGVDTDYFDVEVELDSTTIIPGGKANVTVTVELIRTPTEKVETSVDVAVVASASEYTAQQ